ncbi:B-cell receptor CD22 [Merluccius polli]|uniref:B-cell receptor CD22 n=1 Tax=Merluccius polli TaxID=89951 RepID=A0AA47P561_MERPO|nr:B-cell receptor CD22 [Merluccius polli]
MTCLFFTALQGYGEWGVTYTSSNVCALRGSTVEISCTYRYPKVKDGRYTTVQKTLWFTKTDGNKYLLSDTDYADRVKYSCGENSCTGNSCYGKCTLRIRDLRLSDSAAGYKFRFETDQPGGKYTGDPGVTLSVTDLQVKVPVPDPTHPTLADLECHSMCGLAGPYNWTRRGQSVGRGRSYRVDIRSEDIFSCAVEGYEHLPSPPVCKSTPQCTDIMPGCLFFTALQRYGDWRVTYTSNVCALRGSTVEISCTYTYPKEQDGRDTTVQKTLWLTKRDGDKYVDLRSDKDYADRVEYSCEDNSCNGKSLRIRDLRLSDSAEYKFRFITNQPGGKYTGEPGVTLSVTDLQVKVSFPDPTHPTLADLECHSMCGLAGPYIWTRSGQFVGRGRSYWFYIGSEDIYSCAVEGYEHLPSPPVYAPKTPSVTVRPSGEIEEGSSVTLSCSSDANPAAKYTWFKDNTDDSSRYMNQGQQLVFGPIKSSDSGQYYCLVETELRTKSASIYINVKYGPKHTSVISSPSGGVKEGSSVTLSCSTDANPAANYTWFKDNTVYRDMNQRQQLVFDRVNSSDSGKYLCEAKNEFGTKSASISINVKYGPKHTSVTSSPSGGVKEGSSVTLSCSSDANPAANYTWFKEHEDSVIESGQNYTITDITSELGGNYYCQAHNAIGPHNSTFLSINVTETYQQMTTTVGTIGSVAVLLTIILLLITFLWMRRKRASRKASALGPDIAEEPLPVYGNVLALTNHAAPAALREPIERQDDLHYASIHVSRSENQEVPRCSAGSRVQSDQTDEVVYSVVKFKITNAVPEGRDQAETGETSELYSTVKKHPRV